MKISHVIWDWNGTLVNDADLCVEIVNELLVEFDQKPINIKFYLENFELPVKKFYRKIGLPTTLDLYDYLSNNFIQSYREKYVRCQLQIGALKCIYKLCSFNITQSVLSAGMQSDLDIFIKHFQLTKYFKTINGVNDIHANGKLDLGIRHVNQISCHKSKILLIGDTLHDAEIAQDIGVKCLLYSGGHNSKLLLRESRFPIINTLSEVLPFLIS